MTNIIGYYNGRDTIIWYYDLYTRHYDNTGHCGINTGHFNNNTEHYDNNKGYKEIKKGPMMPKVAL